MISTNLIGLITFCFVSSITPGPNNLMLMASGANFGFRRSLGHLFGVTLGFSFMVLLVGIGLAQIFELYPVLEKVLLVASVAYLLFLVWKIANAGPIEKETQNTAAPMTFMQAAMFQWVNPKGWNMAVTSVTVYASSTDVMSIIMVSFVYFMVMQPSISLWVVMGQKISQFLTNSFRYRVFNWSMAVLLVMSLYPMLLD